MDRLKGIVHSCVGIITIGLIISLKMEWRQNDEYQTGCQTQRRDR